MSTILVTGATDGLGRALTERLIADGHEVLAHGRSAERLAALEGVRTLQADFASLADVRALAEQVGELDVLVNNAGIGSGLPEGRERQESRDGIELRFQVNYLAGFLLTERLLERIRRPGRIVFVSSLGQAPVDFDDPLLERSYSGVQAYCQSKLAQVAYAKWLAAKLPADEVTVNSLHPSTFMPTKMVLQERGSSLDTLERGTEATLRLITDPALDGVTGRFFDREHEAGNDPWADDPEHQQRLVELSRRLVS